MGSSFMDQRLSLAVDGLLVTLDLLVISCSTGTPDVNQVNLIPKFMDVINSGWRDKLIGLSSDSKNTRIGCRGGFINIYFSSNRRLMVSCATDVSCHEGGFAKIDDGRFVERKNL